MKHFTHLCLDTTSITYFLLWKYSFSQHFQFLSQWTLHIPSDTHTVHSTFVLSIPFTHRWLHKLFIIKESITRPTWPDLFIPPLEFLGKKVLISKININVSITIITTISNYNTNNKRETFLSKISGNRLNTWGHVDLTVDS